MLIAIDHGNYAVKTPSFPFVSGLSEHTVKPPLTDEIIEYAGRYWTLCGKRLNYMRVKTRDERYFILSLFAIAKELEAHGSGTGIQKIDLSIGLPPEHYGALTEYLQKHPQLSEESCKIEIRATGYDWEKVEEFIRKLIDEKLSSAYISNEIGTESEKIDKESLEEDVAKMLENINLF